MLSFIKYAYLLSNALICVYILLLVKSRQNHQLFVSKNINSSSIIVYQNFSCETWRSLSYINSSKYHKCLTWKRDLSFWGKQRLRHTAHKHLLNASSLIIEVGGNRAYDTVKFIEFYNSSIISYEPLVSMAKSLKKQFKSNPKVDIQPYGFGNRARYLFVEPYDIDNEGTSIFRKISSINSSRMQRIELLDVVQVIQYIRKTRTNNGIIDMISINCEGCEFEILPALIMNNMTQYIRIIQFATHIELLSDSTCIYCQIEQGLERTHTTLYHYKKVWEGWVLKNDTNNH